MNDSNTYCADKPFGMNIPIFTFLPFYFARNSNFDDFGGGFKPEGGKQYFDFVSQLIVS